jgi:hypothetical protein
MAEYEGSFRTAAATCQEKTVAILTNASGRKCARRTIMAWKVEFTVPKRELQRKDIEFDILQNGKKLGKLKVSQGGVDWVRKGGGKKNTHRFTWATFDHVMTDNSRNNNGATP